MPSVPFATRRTPPEGSHGIDALDVGAQHAEGCHLGSEGLQRPVRHRHPPVGHAALAVVEGPNDVELETALVAPRRPRGSSRLRLPAGSRPVPRATAAPGCARNVPSGPSRCRRRTRLGRRSAMSTSRCTRRPRGTQRIGEPVSQQPGHPQHVDASGVDRQRTHDGTPGYHPPSPSAIPCTGSRRPVISSGVMPNQRWR
jgi:hypothetical protein